MHSNRTLPSFGLRTALSLIALLFLQVRAYSANAINRQDYAQGLHQMGKGQYQSAVVSFKEAVKRNDRAAKACIKIVEAYKMRQNLDEGLLYFEGLARMNPENPYYHHGLGLFYREMKDKDKAREQFRLSMQLAPDYARAVKDFIDVMNQMNRLDEAAKDLKNLRRTRPRDAAGYYVQGYLRLVQNRFEEALDDADKAVKRDKNFLDAYHLKAMLLSSMGRFNELFEISQLGLKIALDHHDVEFQYLFLGNMGYAEYFLADYPKTLEYCGKALGMAVENGDRPEEIRNLQYIGNAYRDTGRPNEALDHFNRALRVSMEIGDRRSEGSSDRLIGTAYTFLCEFLQARKYFQKALPIAVETGNDNLKALVLCGLGSVSWNLGDYTVALTYLNEALGISEKRNYPVVIQMCLGTMGLVHWNLGHFSEALECYERALAIARKHGLKIWEGIHLGNIAVIFTDSGDYSTALTYYEQAMRIAVETGSKILEGMHLNNMAGIYSDRLHQHGKAMDYYRKALLLATESGDKRLEADFLGNIGFILRITGKKAEAAPVIQKALNISRRISHKGGEAWQLMNLGGLYDDEGDLDRAVSCYGNSLALGKRLCSPVIILKSHLGIGTVTEKRGHNARALAQYRKAIEEIEVFRDRLSTEELKTFFLETEFDAYEKIMHLLHRMHRINPRQGYDRESFRYAEKAKARSLLDIIDQANVFQNLDKIPRALRDTVVSNDNLLGRNYRSLSEAMNQTAGERDLYRVSQIKQTIETLRRKRTRLLEQLKQNNPEYYDLTHPRPISADAVQKNHLDDSQILVEYFVSNEAVYVWALTRQKMSFQAIGLGRAGLEKTLARISPLFLREKRNLSATTDYRWANIQKKALHDLYKTLLQGPVGTDLTKCGQIIIVADDLLNYFPFEMLVTDMQGEKVHYLAEDHSVSYLCSSSFLSRKPKPEGGPRGNLLAFGNPYTGRTWRDKLLNPGEWFRSDKALFMDETFQPLPEAEREVKGIAANFVHPSVYIGKDATEERFKRLAGEYRYIHLATHFVTSDMQPMLSKVVLSQNRQAGEDGYLQMYEVYNLALKAELAILSGCNTGSGELRRGEGLIGISRAFYYAGASNLIVSLWPVEDESTALLMKSFYGYLGMGLSKSRALRRAKIDFILSPDSRQDPFYWGPFVLIGES